MGEFILEIPKWTGELVFSYDILQFVMIILVLFAGLLVVFGGYSKLQGSLFIGSAGVLLLKIYQLLDPYVSQKAPLLFMVVSCTIIGVAFIYFIWTLFESLTEILKINLFLQKKCFCWTPFVGAGIFAFIVENYVFKSLQINIGIFVVLSLLGIIIQFKNRKKQVVFKTYYDLLKMEPLQ